ncbi:hypothetical protein [Terrarubrum flagellatum]|uniref:hypothetical protein n=1 Tax=Terrirubrum flagellatum TaxID=2895980 RepID=UPI003144E107
MNTALKALCGLMLFAVSAEAQTPPMAELKVQGGQRFVLIGPKNPWNAQAVSHNGEPGWISMECRENERAPGANTASDRIGFDGYVQTIGPVAHIRFSVVPGENAFAAGPQDWLNFFELHAKPAPGDKVENAGPLLFTWEWSPSTKKSEFRISRQEIIADPPTDLSSYKRTVLYRSAPMMQIGARADFVVDIRADLNNTGYVKVWMNGHQIVNYNGSFGYGANRPLYPQFRIYRNARSVTSKALFKIDEVTSSAAP